MPILPGKPLLPSEVLFPTPPGASPLANEGFSVLEAPPIPSLFRPRETDQKISLETTMESWSTHISSPLFYDAAIVFGVLASIVVADLLILEIYI